MGSKNLETCSRDEISWFPDEILGKILSSLPTEQAVSTSVLAKRWRNVYRLVDSLDFDDSFWGEEKLETNWKWVGNYGTVAGQYVDSGYMFPERFKNFVDTTLASQCDYPIKKLSLKCHIDEENNCQKACVEGWISKVLECGVSEVELSITDQGSHFIPSQILASKTLVKLTLGTKLKLGKLPLSVSLPSLKTLFIDSAFSKCDVLCGLFLAGCPVLEELTLHHKRSSGMPHTISSPTIKRLSVKYDHRNLHCMSFDLPKLVYLDNSHFALAKYPRVNLEALVEAKLDLHTVYVKHKKWSPDVKNLFLGTRNVKILRLSSLSVDVISECVVNYGLFLPVFNNLIKLSFGSNKNKRGWRFLSYLLKQSPKLETLIIQDLNGYSRKDVSMPPNKVKLLHILGYQETTQALKQLKSLVWQFKCLEMVQVRVVGEDNSTILQTRTYRM